MDRENLVGKKGKLRQRANEAQDVGKREYRTPTSKGTICSGM